MNYKNKIKDKNKEGGSDIFLLQNGNLKFKKGKHEIN